MSDKDKTMSLNEINQYLWKAYLANDNRWAISIAKKISKETQPIFIEDMLEEKK